MLYVLGYCLALAGLLVVLWLPGELLASGLLRGERLGPLAGLARLVLGLGFWTVVLFLLASLGLLRPASVGLVAVACLLAVAWRARRTLRPGWQGWRARLQRGRWRPEHVLLGVALAVVLLPIALLAMNPGIGWDDGVYHLTLPRLFLEHQGFRAVPFNVYSHWPLGTELLFALAMLGKDYVLAKLLHFAFGLATLYALLCGARANGGGRLAGLLAMAFFLANDVVAFELRVAYVDLAVSFYFLAAVLFVVRALDRPQHGPTALLLAGISAGLLAGAKVTGILSAGLVAGLYLPRLVAAARHGTGGRTLATFLVRFVLPLAALWLPWVVKSAWLTGNPVYPFLYRFFGGPDWSPELGEKFQAWQSSIGAGREPMDYLLLPFRVVLEGGRGYHRFDGEIGAFWIVLVPFAALAGWRYRLVRRCLGLALAGFVVWSLTSQQMRFLIPLLPLAALAAAVTIVRRLRWLGAGRRRRVQLAVVLLAAGLVVASNSRALPRGISMARTYARAGTALHQRVVPPVFAFVGRELPADARILFLNYNQGFFCPREYLADSFFEASQIADWLRPAGSSVAELRRLLAARRVTHVLVAARDWGIAYPPALFALLQDPSQVEIVYQAPDRSLALLALRE